MSLETRWWQDVIEKASTQQKAEPPGLRLSSTGEQDNADGHKSGGVNILQSCSVSNSLSHTNLSNKVRGIFFFKEVFARLYSLRQYVFCMYMCIYAYLLCGYTTLFCHTNIEKFRSISPISQKNLKSSPNLRGIFYSNFLPQTRCDKVNFLCRLEFRVFLLDCLPNHSWRILSTLQFSHNWRYSRWIYTFLNSISLNWNANLIQNFF